MLLLLLLPLSYLVYSTLLYTGSGLFWFFFFGGGGGGVVTDWYYYLELEAHKVCNFV